MSDRNDSSVKTVDESSFSLIATTVITAEGKIC